MKPVIRFVAVLALIAGCAYSPPKIWLTGSPLTPAAEGWVIAAPGQNGNTRLTLEVKHLAPPERLMPPAKVYVVWSQPPGAQPQNLGALTVDQNLTGRLDTVTPFQRFTLFITAEQFPSTTAPTGPHVLHGLIEGA